MNNYKDSRYNFYLRNQSIRKIFNLGKVDKSYKTFLNKKVLTEYSTIDDYDGYDDYTIDTYINGYEPFY